MKQLTINKLELNKYSYFDYIDGTSIEDITMINCHISTIRFKGIQKIECFNCYMEICEWSYGTSVDSLFNNCFWYNGEWINGTAIDMTWRGGDWFNGLWLNGQWKYGNWYGGTWVNGIWKDGNWLGGKWISGVWHKGHILNPFTNHYEYSKIDPNEYYKKIGYIK